MTDSTADQVWLFGSYARGDADVASDIDILCIGEIKDRGAIERIAVTKGLPIDRLDIAFYTREAIEGLASKGSLFTWHLRDEGRPIYTRSQWLRKSLRKMPRYASHVADLQVLQTLLHDVEDSLCTSANSTIYDAGIIGTVIRNTGIIVTDFLGAADYSPYAPMSISALEPRLKPPVRDEEYDVLLSCRRASERPLPMDQLDLRASITTPECLVSAAKNWLADCINYLTCQGVRYVQ
ncbi:MAG: nucleotidyltransferase domain-containing protein [Ktedonobacteraceae bacterium]